MASDEAEGCAIDRKGTGKSDIGTAAGSDSPRRDYRCTWSLLTALVRDQNIEITSHGGTEAIRYFRLKQQCAALLLGIIERRSWDADESPRYQVRHTSLEAASPRGGGRFEALQEALLLQVFDLGLHVGLLEVGFYLLYLVRERMRGLSRFGSCVLTIDIDDCTE